MARFSRPLVLHGRYLPKLQIQGSNLDRRIQSAKCCRYTNLDSQRPKYPSCMREPFSISFPRVRHFLSMVRV